MTVVRDLVVLVVLTTTIAAYHPIVNLFRTNAESHDKEVVGTCPVPWLTGALHRVGPAKYEHGGRTLNNAMDGLAKLHSWHFGEEGTVTYTSTLIPTLVYNRTMEEGGITAYSLMGRRDPDFSPLEILDVVLGGADYSDNTNIAVWDLDGGHSVTVTGESFNTHQYYPDGMTYRRPYTLPGRTGGMMDLFSAAHPSRRPGTASSINYKCSIKLSLFSPPFRYTFFEYVPDADGVVSERKIGVIKTDQIRMIHQFGATEKYIVIPRWNYAFKLNLGDFFHNTVYMCDAFEFDYKNPAYVDIMNIETGRYTTFEFQPQKAMHIMNTFERVNEQGQTEIVMDFPTTSDVHDKDLNGKCVFDIFNLEVLDNSETLFKDTPWNTTLRRFVMNLDTGDRYIEEMPQLWTPTESLIDFPYINPAYRGKPYCYTYFHQWNLRTHEMDIMKYDVCKKEVISWSEEHVHLMEPVFVARPGGEEEDDGVVLAQAYNSDTDSSYLNVWNAKDLSLIGSYGADDVHIPFTVHGDWFFSN